MIDYYELLDEYMEGRLSPDLEEQFKRELMNNRSLQMAIENYSLGKTISHSLIELETREHLRKLQSRNSNRFYFLKIAACIILLVGIGWAVKLNQDRIDTQETFAELYNRPIASIARGGKTFSKIDTAIILFDSKQYEDAKRWLVLIPKEDESYIASIWYLAHIAIQEKNYHQAEFYFSQVTHSNDSYLQLEAQYNLMLLAILNNDKATTRKIYETHFKSNKWIAEKKMEVLRDWVK